MDATLLPDLHPDAWRGIGLLALVVLCLLAWRGWLWRVPGLDDLLGDGRETEDEDEGGRFDN